MLFDVSDVRPLDDWSGCRPDSSLRLTLETVSILSAEIDCAERAHKSDPIWIYKEEITSSFYSIALPRSNLNKGAGYTGSLCLTILNKSFDYRIGIHIASGNKCFF